MQRCRKEHVQGLKENKRLVIQALTETLGRDLTDVEKTEFMEL